MRLIKRLAKLVGVVLIIAILVLLVLTAIAHFQVRREVAQLVTPVLSSRWDDTDSGVVRTEDLLDRVLKDNTGAGDEASAILLGYYLGVHNSEEQMVNMSQRGKRVLPYLLKYQKHPPLPPRPDFWLFRLYGAERSWRYDEAISMINKGEVLQE